MRLIQLPELGAHPERTSFQPALDRLEALRGEPDPWLRGFFSADLPLHIARAPGRLDVMGGIADYSGARVLELPLGCSTSALVQRQASPRCEVATRREGRWHRFGMELPPLVIGKLRTPEALREWFTGRKSDQWAAYVLGVVQSCLQHAAPPARKEVLGFRLLIDSTVPEGRGVGSSAALEVSVMAVVAASCGTIMTPPDLAAACQRVENLVAGAPCGIMDQMTSACGRRDRLLRLRCQPGTIEGYLEVPPGYRFYGIDSGIRHAVKGSDYETVRTAAFMGFRMIADAAALTAVREGIRVRITDPRWGGYLANVTPDEFWVEYESRLPQHMAGAEFLERYAGTTDTVTQVRPDRSYPVRAATAHPITEQARVGSFELLLRALTDRPEAAIELGRLMYASHRSYGSCGLGSDGTDRLVEMVAAAGPERGLFGAKITGGGSGGTVAVLGTSAAESLVREIAARYTAETGRDAIVFSESGPGAAETGVLILASPTGG